MCRRVNTSTLVTDSFTDDESETYYNLTLSSLGPFYCFGVFYWNNIPLKHFFCGNV